MEGKGFRPLPFGEEEKELSQTNECPLGEEDIEPVDWISNTDNGEMAVCKKEREIIDWRALLDMVEINARDVALPLIPFFDEKGICEDCLLGQILMDDHGYITIVTLKELPKFGHFWLFINNAPFHTPNLKHSHKRPEISLKMSELGKI